MSGGGLFILHPSSFILFFLGVALAACSPEAPPASTKPAESAPAATVPEPPHEGWQPLHVKIVDLDGNALPGVAPVAVSQPNAFEKPVSVGEPADKNGDAVLHVPPDQRLYVRGWDFTLGMFANNFYDVYPGPRTEPGVLRLVMVPAGSLRVQLATSEDAPVANEKVGLMLYHPTKGAWWPSEATTNEKGAAVFSPVPPGVFTAKLKTASGHIAEINDVTIQPSGLQDLHKIFLE